MKPGRPAPARRRSSLPSGDGRGGRVRPVTVCWQESARVANCKEQQRAQPARPNGNGEPRGEGAAFVVASSSHASLSPSPLRRSPAEPAEHLLLVSGPTATHSKHTRPAPRLCRPALVLNALVRRQPLVSLSLSPSRRARHSTAQDLRRTGAEAQAAARRGPQGSLPLSPGPPSRDRPPLPPPRSLTRLSEPETNADAHLASQHAIVRPERRLANPSAPDPALFALAEPRTPAAPCAPRPALVCARSSSNPKCRSTSGKYAPRLVADPTSLTSASTPHVSSPRRSPPCSGTFSLLPPSSACRASPTLAALQDST